MNSEAETILRRLVAAYAIESPGHTCNFSMASAKLPCLECNRNVAINGAIDAAKEYAKAKEAVLTKHYDGKDAKPIYEKIIEPIREKARELGYAIGVHGTLRRDIDLIACPWGDQAVDAKTLAEAVRLVALEVYGAAYMIPPENTDPFHIEGCPGMKPHGRLSWCFHMGGGPYIDLAVMPRNPDHTVEKMPSEFRVDT